jgi:hypothetical protein
MSPILIARWSLGRTCCIGFLLANEASAPRNRPENMVMQLKILFKKSQQRQERPSVRIHRGLPDQGTGSIHELRRHPGLSRGIDHSGGYRGNRSGNRPDRRRR